MIQVRLTQSQDVGEIVAFENEHFNPTTEEYFINNVMNDSLIQSYTLVSDSLFLGYMVLWMDDRKMQIYSLGIKSFYRQKGYSKRLLDFALDLCQKHQVKEITLEVRKSNERAIKLYQSYGFETIQVRENYYKNNEDALLLYCKL